MNGLPKFSVSFGLALALHLTILALFGISFSKDKTELVKQKPAPELIHAALVDDSKIQQEAERLELEKKHQQFIRNKKQQLEQQKKQQKQEQARLKQVKKERIQQEKKAQALEEKNKQRAIKEKQQKQQRLEAENKLKVKEAARLSKIKQKKAAEQKKQEKLRKEKQQKQAAEKKKQDAKRLAQQKQKQKQALLAKKKRQKALLDKQRAEANAKAALVAKQAAEAAGRAKAKQDKQATISSAAAIQQKVNNRWIKPLSAAKGLRCTIRVKLLPSGDVMDVRVVSGSGDSVFDRSAENAVLKASPLPVPKDRALFSKKFRTFTFVFKPE